MPSDFTALLRQLIQAKSLTIRAFAAKIRRSPGYVNDILHDRRCPPEDSTAWADALGLAGIERDGFLLAAGLTRTPPSVVDHIRRQTERIAAMEAKTTDRAKMPSPR